MANKKKHKATPDFILRTMADTFEQKNEEYGSIYKEHEKIMMLLFPEGITLKTPDDFNTYHYITMCVAKIHRASNYFRTEHGIHIDSFQDLGVYAAMALEVVEEEDDAKE